MYKLLLQVFYKSFFCVIGRWQYCHCILKYFRKIATLIEHNVLLEVMGTIQSSIEKMNMDCGLALTYKDS